MTVKEFLFSARSFPKQKIYPVEIMINRNGKLRRLFRTDDISDLRYLTTHLFDAPIRLWAIINGTIVIHISCVYERQCGIEGHCFEHYCSYFKKTSVENGVLKKSYSLCDSDSCPIQHPSLCTKV